MPARATEMGFLDFPAQMQRVYRRDDRMDRQFELIFGRNMDEFYVHPLIGFDICRFDHEVLHSGDITPEEALLRRVLQAMRDGVKLIVYGPEFVYYIRYLTTRQSDDQPQMLEEYAARFKTLWEGMEPPARKAAVQPTLWESLP